MMRKTAIGIATIFVMLVMVSTASAVPYENGNQLNQVILKIDEAQNRAEVFRASPLFQQIKQIVDANFPSGYNQYMYDQLVSRISSVIPEGLLGDSTDSFYDILCMIAEAIMLLLGHNIIGQTASMLVTLIVAIPLALFAGFGVSIEADLTELSIILMFMEIDWAEAIQQIGIIGAFILQLSLLAIGALMMVMLIPVNIILCIGEVYGIYILDIFNYIYGTVPLQTKMQMQEQQLIIMKQPLLSEKFNSFREMILQQKTGMNIS